MLRDFSDGYYYATMTVQEYSDGPVIERGLHDFIQQELYVDDSSPVMMRVGLDSGELFDVDAEASVPRDLLALPVELIDNRGEQSVFVLKSQYTDTVGAYHG